MSTLTLRKFLGKYGEHLACRRSALQHTLKFCESLTLKLVKKLIEKKGVFSLRPILNKRFQRDSGTAT